MPYPTVAAPGNPYGPQTTFRTENVLPPSAVYVGPDDAIVIYIRNPSLSATIFVNYRLLSPDGTIVPNSQSFTCLSVGATPFIYPISPTEGYLMSLSLFAPTTSRGQVFARVFLQRGTNQPTPVIDQVLLQGYVSDDDRLGYPQSPTESALSGRGWVHRVQGVQPAAGADFNITVPPGVRWKIKSVLAQLNANTSIGTLEVVFTISDPSFSLMCFIPPGAVQATPNDFIYTWGEGINYTSLVSFAQSVPLFNDLVLGPGWHFGTQTLGILAPAFWGVPNCYVEEWVAQ